MWQSNKILAMKYIKNGKISNGKFVKENGLTLINPSKEKMLELGWEVYRTDEQEEYEKEIVQLKVELSETDYRIIKCYEASLLGEELPYNASELHATRQALRDRINQLESKL